MSTHNYFHESTNSQTPLPGENNNYYRTMSLFVFVLKRAKISPLEQIDPYFFFTRQGIGNRSQTKSLGRQLEIYALFT